MPTDPRTEPLRFAYWVPNVSGGLVTSTIEQRTDWGYDYNRKLAQLAENNGFDYALSQVRYMASYGAEYPARVDQLLARAAAGHRAAQGDRRRAPRAVASGRAGQVGATADHLSNGRFAVNVVSGWFKGEFRQLGEPWLEHDERYRRSEEFIRALRAIWTQDDAKLAGDFYRIRDFTLKPKPLYTPGRPHPEIFQGGNSTAARAMAAGSPTGTSPTARTSTGSRAGRRRCAHAADAGARTDRRFGLNGFVIVRDTEAEARETLREIIAKADVEAVEGFRDAVEQAGRSTSDKQGMWADSSFEDLVQYNDGFRTQLIGTPRADRRQRIIEYASSGVDLMLRASCTTTRRSSASAEDVLPIVRELEIENGLDPAAVPESSPMALGGSRRCRSPDDRASTMAPVIGSDAEAMAVVRGSPRRSPTGDRTRPRGRVTGRELAEI